MKSTTRFRAALGVVGGVAAFAGVAHVAWHSTLRRYPELSGIGEGGWQFIALLNLAAALLLLFMAVVTFEVATSKAVGLRELRAYTAVLAVGWAVRLALELVFPVRLPLITAHGTSDLVKVLIVANLAVLATPEVLLRVRPARG